LVAGALEVEPFVTAASFRALISKKLVIATDPGDRIETNGILVDRESRGG
jgi:hypothetical protein